MHVLKECLLLGVLKATAIVLLLLRLDLGIALLRKEHLLIHLVLLVLAHKLIELLLRLLHLRHKVLRGIPREPRTHLTKLEVVLGVLALENLGKDLSLLEVGKNTTDLDTADIATVLDFLILGLLNRLLILEEEDLVLLLNICLLDGLLVDLRELLCILHEIVNLDILLLGEEGHEVLKTTNLPLLILPADELLKEEAVLVANHRLGGKKRDEGLTLRRVLRILLEIVNHLVRLVKLGKGLELTRHYASTPDLAESLFSAPSKMASPVVLAVVFFLLSPGVLVTIPPFLPPSFFSGRTSVVAAAVHAGVF